MSPPEWAEGSEIHKQPEAEARGGTRQDQEHHESPVRLSIASASSDSLMGLFEESSYPPGWDESWVIGDDGNWEPPQPRWPSSPLSMIGKIRGALHAFWLRNKGVLYVLLSQFFGSCMNLATRILENSG